MFCEFIFKKKDNKLITYINNCLDMIIYYSEILNLSEMKHIFIKAQKKFYELYYFTKEELYQNYTKYNFDVNLDLIRILTGTKFFVITGTSSCGKSSMLNKYEFDCKISFDELLTEKSISK